MVIFGGIFFFPEWAVLMLIVQFSQCIYQRDVLKDGTFFKPGQLDKYLSSRGCHWWSVRGRKNVLHIGTEWIISVPWHTSAGTHVPRVANSSAKLIRPESCPGKLFYKADCLKSTLASHLFTGCKYEFSSLVHGSSKGTGARGCKVSCFFPLYSLYCRK